MNNNTTVLNLAVGQKKMYQGVPLLLDGGRFQVVMDIPKAANIISKNLSRWSDNLPHNRHERLVLEGNAPAWIYLVAFTTLSSEFSQIDCAVGDSGICLQSPQDQAPAAESRDIPRMVDTILSSLAHTPSLAENAFPEPTPVEQLSKPEPRAVVAREVPVVPAKTEDTGLDSPVAWEGEPHVEANQATA